MKPKHGLMIAVSLFSIPAAVSFFSHTATPAKAAGSVVVPHYVEFQTSFQNCTYVPPEYKIGGSTGALSCTRR